MNTYVVLEVLPDGSQSSSIHTEQRKAGPEQTLTVTCGRSLPGHVIQLDVE